MRWTAATAHAAHWFLWNLAWLCGGILLAFSDPAAEAADGDLQGIAAGAGALRSAPWSCRFIADVHSGVAATAEAAAAGGCVAAC